MNPNFIGGGAPSSDHNFNRKLISSFDQIEEARHEVAQFRQHLMALIDFFEPLVTKIKEQDLLDRLDFAPGDYEEKLTIL